MASSFTTFSVVLRVKLEVPSASAEVTRFFKISGGTAEVDVVASTFLVAEGNGAVAVHLDINEGIGAHLVAAAGGNLLLLQLVLEGRLEFGSVQSAVGLVEQLQLSEVQRDLSCCHTSAREPLMVLSGFFRPA